MTDQLCRAAWSFFQEIETSRQAPRPHLVCGRSNKSPWCAQKRASSGRPPQRRAHRRDFFPDLAEARTVPDSALRARERLIRQPLPPIRLAEPFEALRDVSDAHLAKARATAEDLSRQSRNRRRVSPRARPLPRTFSRLAALRRSSAKAKPRLPCVTRFSASGAALACLCSSPTGLRQRDAAAAAQALKTAGANHIYLAGRPGERRAP